MQFVHTLNPVLVGAVAAIIVLPLLVLLLAAIWYHKTSNGPSAPPIWTGGWPIIGHFGKFASNPLATIRDGYNKLGPVFTMRFLDYNMTFLIGADAHTPFFRANDEELSQNEPYKFMTPVFGKGIVFDCPIDIKDQQLKFVASALKGTALRTYVPEIVKEAKAYFEGWGDSGEVDLLDEMSRLTILTASRCLLGREIRETLFGEVCMLLREIDEGINPIAIFFPYAPLPAFRRRDKARAEIAELLAGVIKGRRENTGEKPDDMLQSFIEAEYRDGSRCTDDQITGMLIGVLFAGQHTSAITSTWLTLNLLHHPQYFKRVMKEQVTVLKSTDPTDVDVLTMDNLQQLDFMHNCMKESIRQYPPLIMLMRKAHVPLNVGTYTVPKDHYVIAPLAVTMNLPPTAKEANFTNPTTFDPDRFSPERKEDKKPFSFCAFGGGKHGCLGEQFGYLQVKTIVSMMLRRFEIEPLGPLPRPNYAAMVVGPLQEGNATRIRYRRRTTPLPDPSAEVEAVMADLGMGAGAGAGAGVAVA